MKNKVLVHLIIPDIDESYDIYIPVNIRIGMVIKLLNKSLVDISKGLYEIKDNRNLYNMEDTTIYDINKLVRETNIRNGVNVIFM